MGEALRKISEEVPVTEFPYAQLLTKVLMDAFCGILKCQATFGEVRGLGEEDVFPHWIDAKLVGDVSGRLGLGADQGALLSLAKQIQCYLPSGQPDFKGAIAVLHEALAASIEKQFGDEDLACDLKRGSGYQQNYHPQEPGMALCSVRTPFGTISVVFAFQAMSSEMIEEAQVMSGVFEARKIRVYASQLESLFEGIRNLEGLEQRLLQGPQVRSQMRSQIKKLKRGIHHLKTEPLETLFSPARKLVTELAKQQGKQIAMESHGTWLFLDKTLLNYLYEPVLHLIRNAVEHGIEEPLERERVGKNPIGQLRAQASFAETNLKLLFTDDGRGLDFGAIRERAVAKGMLTAEESVLKTNDQLSELVLEPGFTTQDNVDTSATRGLGLDIVRRTIEEIGGTLRLVSTSLHGTSWEITINLAQDFSQVRKHLKLPVAVTSPKPEDERLELLDELDRFFDRFASCLAGLEEARTSKAAYEAYRLIHSIKGVCGFLGWNRVASFCHSYEDLLKALSEEKAPLNDSTLSLILEAGTRLREFADASRQQSSYSLYLIRQIESRLLQLIWSATKSDDKTHLFLGKYHLNAVENHLLAHFKGATFSVRPEADFSKAVALPFGAMIQFNGDRRGFAGIFLREKTYSEIILPMVSGTSADGENAKRNLWALSEFVGLMGGQFAESCSKVGITLQPSSPLTYYGLGQPLRMLGQPTYCYECEIDGKPFYLAGDFRSPQEISEGVASEPLCSPQTFVDLTKSICEEKFGVEQLKVLFNESPTQSDLIGFDGAVSTIMSCKAAVKGSADMVLFLSFDASLSQYFFERVTGNLDLAQCDLYDALTQVSLQIGERLVQELATHKIDVVLSSPSVFLGKAYVANFNRLYVTNKVVGNTDKGRFELQILITELAE